MVVVATDQVPEFLSPAQLAEWIGVSVRSLEDWRAGKVESTKGPPFTRLSDQVIRYRRSDVERWLRSRETNGRGVSRRSARLEFTPGVDVRVRFGRGGLGGSG